MKLRPVAASEFLSFNETAQELLTQYGGIPVNDALLPAWDTSFDISLIYGGRGGGKSEGIVDELLNECLTQDYFKCYYGRKVYDTVRGSCYETFVAGIKKNKLEKYFTFSEAPTSGMHISCNINGNRFIPFGSDKAEKLKSIKDPTHIWCEEFDQFEFNDFKTLLPTLRTQRGLNRFIGTFNAYEILPNHWLLKIFFPEKYQVKDKNDDVNADLLNDKKVQNIFINYTDNYFLDQEKYKGTLWIAAAGDYGIFQGLANGDFGVILNDSPWAYAFSKKKHVSNGLTIPHPVLNRKEPVYLSWDFNRNPMCCNVIQWYNNTVYVLEVIKQPNSGVDSVCNYIKEMYPGCLFIVTGDYSGMTETSLFQEQVTHYSLIMHHLSLSENQLVVRPNPRLHKNATHVNMILAFYNVIMHGRNALPLIFDMEHVKRRADGTIVKDDRDDPTQQADSLDGFRYFCNIFLDWFKPA